MSIAENVFPKKMFVSLGLSLLLSANNAFSDTAILDTVADGHTYGYGSGTAYTSETYTNLYRSYISNKSIFEFDISSVPDDAILTDVSLKLVFTDFRAGSDWLPITINFYAYAGDGIVNATDHVASATLIASKTYTEEQKKGTVLDLSINDLYSIQSIIDDKNVNYLTVRAWCVNNMFIGGFSSLENTVYDPATLTLEYSAVPIPSTFFLLGMGLLSLLGYSRRKL